MAELYPTIQDERGNRLVFRPSPLQQPKLRAAPAEAPPPPRERTLIVPLEALKAMPAQPVEEVPAAKPSEPKVSEPKPSVPKAAAPKATQNRSAAWVYIVLALVLLAALVAVIF